MTSGKSPLVIPALFWITGLILGRIISPNYLIVSLIFLTGIFIWLIFKKITIIFLLITFLGILRYQADQYCTKIHISHLFREKSEIVQPVTGTICSEVIRRDKKSYFELELAAIADLPVKGKIRFSCQEGNLSYGQKISTTALLSSIRASSNPYAFNYREYLQYKKIYALGMAKKSVNILGKKSNILKQLTIIIRKYIRKRIEQRCPAHAGFIKAIIIGDRSDLAEIRNTLTQAGLSHILAVSGLHVALIALTLFTILKMLIGHRVILRIFTILLLILYGAICNWSPSVSRAVIMISLYFMAQILQRQVNSLNILSCSLIIITAISPLQLFSVGLQLSFCAVLVLLLIIPKFTGFIYRIPVKLVILRKILQGILTLIVVSLILSLFLAPITLYYFNQFNLNGIIGNILGIPLISIILPLCILLILLPPVQFLVGLYQSSLEMVLSLFNWWGELASALPFHFTFIPFSTVQVIAAFLFLVVLFWIFRSYNKFKSGLLALILVFNSFLWIGKESHNLKVIFFNCGLGDLCYIRTPAQENIMIDCGPTDKDPDAFSRSALPYFQNQGIREIDWLIITHAHNDHYGGIDDILEHLEVQNLLVTDEFQTRSFWVSLNEKIIQERANIITVSDTCSIPLRGVNLKILHPDINYSDENINNMSIVARLDYQELSILFNGDLEKEGEQYLISRYPFLLDCDISKVGHHGSKTSSTPEYIELVSPQIAVISTSLKNRFDFPHPVTLEKYSFLEGNLIITGRDGAFLIESDGKNIRYQKHNNIED